MTQFFQSSSPQAPGSQRSPVLPVVALVMSAALWGTSWYPFRVLDGEGVDGLWAVTITEVIAAVLCLLIFGKKMLGLRWSRPLIAIGLLGGACNTGYVIGAIEGEVMRVTLLLYLAPLWTLFLARWMLGETLNHLGIMVVALSLTGAMVMLWPFAEDGVAFSTGDLWGLMAGMAYAGYNVLVRRHLELSVPHKTFSATLGSAVVAVAAMPVLGWPALPAVSAYSGAIMLGLGLILLWIALMMQYGLERLPATRSSVIMVSELLFAALSAWWLAQEVPGLREGVGGMLILVASLLSTRIAPKGIH
ncbi:MAG: DMT family transporter [Rhodocyclaceae bacterium]|nr:DMT family transporter [Rhodocyclaceae bacterium]